MDMYKVTARWTGFPGAPGYSNFFFATGGGLITDAQQVGDRVASAFNNLAGSMVDGVTIQVQSEVQIIDSDTGVLSGYEQINQPAALVGGGTGGYAGPAGGVVNWLTGDVRFGRRIRGRTFIVPLDGDSYDSDGSLSSLAQGNLQDFASDLVGGDIDSEFGIWSRPRGGSGGVFATVTGFNVPDLAAVLRSRRD